MTSGARTEGGESMEAIICSIFSMFWAVSTRSNAFLDPKTDIWPFLDTSGWTAEKASWLGT